MNDYATVIIKRDDRKEERGEGRMNSFAYKSVSLKKIN